MLPDSDNSSTASNSELKEEIMTSIAEQYVEPPFAVVENFYRAEILANELIQQYLNSADEETENSYPNLLAERVEASHHDPVWLLSLVACMLAELHSHTMDSDSGYFQRIHDENESNRAQLVKLGLLA